MPSYYELREMPDLHQTGEKTVYPKFKDIKQVSTEDIANCLSVETSFSEADVVGLLKALSGRLAMEMSRGHSVKLEGIGVFTPSLRFVDTEKSDGGKGKNNSNHNVELGSIKFRADKKLVSLAISQLDLAKSEYSCIRSSQKYSPKERLQLAVEYLKSHASMSIRIYQELTGLRRTTAALELKKWSEMPGSGIRSEGIYTHKRYVLE